MGKENRDITLEMILMTECLCVTMREENRDLTLEMILMTEYLCVQMGKENRDITLEMILTTEYLCVTMREENRDETLEMVLTTEYLCVTMREENRDETLEMILTTEYLCVQMGKENRDITLEMILTTVYLCVTMGEENRDVTLEMIFFFLWHYSPFSLALAFFTIDDHSSLSNAFVLHHFTPNFLRSSSTSFIHLSLGRPLPLRPSNFPSKIFFTDLVSFILTTCPHSTLEMILTEYLCVTVGNENGDNIQCSLF